LNLKSRSGFIDIVKDTKESLVQFRDEERVNRRESHLEENRHYGREDDRAVEEDSRS
jgi:hypothetical protein